MIALRYFIGIAVFFLSTAWHLQAQVVRAGVKGGYRLSWVNFDDKDHKKLVNVYPISGFNVGGVLSFKVKDRYFLHTEYMYSTKGKKVTSNENAENLPFEPDVEDRVTYSFLEVPVMFTVHFKGNIGKDKHFRWYAGFGPNFNYWLGGRGVTTSGEIALESKYKEFGELRYKIKFGDRGDDGANEHVYLNNVNRTQIGLNFSAGLLFEPAERHKVMVDLRYELGSTRLGDSNGTSGYLLPSNYKDSLKSRNHCLTLSAIYLIEFSTDKKARNKGKSTVKKPKPIKRRR